MIFALSISLSNRPQALGAVGKLSTNGNGWRRCNKSGNEHLYCNPYLIAIRQANLKNNSSKTSKINVEYGKLLFQGTEF